MSLERPLARPVRGVPYLDEGVVRTRGQLVPHHSEGQHPALLLLPLVQRHLADPGRRVPQLDGAVVRPGHQPPLALHHGVHAVRVVAERAHQRPRLRVPHLDARVVRGRHQPLLARGQRADRARVVRQRPLALPVRRRPHLDRRVPRPGHEDAVHRAQRRDRVVVLLQQRGVLERAGAAARQRPPAGGPGLRPGPAAGHQRLVLERLHEQGAGLGEVQERVHLDHVRQVTGVHQREPDVVDDVLHVLLPLVLLVAHPPHRGLEHQALVAVQDLVRLHDHQQQAVVQLLEAVGLADHGEARDDLLEGPLAQGGAVEVVGGGEDGRTVRGVQSSCQCGAGLLQQPRHLEPRGKAEEVDDFGVVDLDLLSVHVV
mmetsp:Transcript_5085/g.7745  ORF Transcript_5085/g.7745 Transcript_5085/m.7745 type:complete len:371 (+) Transcript_5085:743-1855(+)